MKYKSLLWVTAGLVIATWGAIRIVPGQKVKAQFSGQEWHIISEMATTPSFKADPSNKVSTRKEAIAFGERLFFYQGFSPNNQVSCGTCHAPDKNWTDHRKLASGMASGTRNTPSLWNTSHNRWFFWDGRSDSQWSQALHPFESPMEIGSSRLSVLHQLYSDPDLREGYETLFNQKLDFLQDTVSFPLWGSPVIPYGDYNPWLQMKPSDRLLVNHHFSNIGKAIAAFEGTIISSPSQFDHFIKSVNNYERPIPYPAQALEGLKLFIGKANCVNCHNGNLLTNREFHNIRLNDSDGARYKGIRQLLVSEFNQNSPYSDDTTASKIRYLKLVKRNWGEFKVPSLRNVAYTAPYMHDGRFAQLTDVVDYYSELENAIADNHVNETIIKPLRLTDEEKENLVMFLKTL